MSETLTQIIFASQTPGVAPAAGAALDTWKITSGGQINRNGILDGTSGNVIALLYHAHFVYQVANATNELGLNPGWWQYTGGTTGNGSGWTAVQSPESETGEAFGVTSVGPIIFASQTAGSAATAGQALDTWTLNNSGHAIHNGTVDPTASSVIQLYYHLHRVYYESTIGNSSGTPGWWSWNGSGWSITTSPVITTPTITVGSIVDQVTGTAFLVAGSILNYTSTPTLQYQDNGTGAWNSLPSGSTVSTTAFSFTHPSESTGTTTATVSVRDANATTVVGTSNVFNITVPGQISLSSISLNNLTFTAGTAPIVVGTVSVATTPAGSFPGTTGTMKITGADATTFSIGSDQATLSTAVTTVQQAYHIGFTATLPGAVGSPLSSPAITVTGQGVSVGPVVSNGTLVNVNFASGSAGPPGNWTNQLVTPYVWGVATGALCNTFGSVPFSTWNNTSLQNTFGSLGLRSLRINATAPILESIFGSQGGTTPGGGFVDFGGGTTISTPGFPIFNNMFSFGNKFFPNGVRVVMGLGNQPDRWSNSNFQNCINQVATYLWAHNSSFPIYGFEFSNEYPGMNASYYTSGIAGMNAANSANGSAYKFFGPTWSYWGAGNATNFKNAVSATTLAAYDYHGYGWGPGGAQIPSNVNTVMSTQFSVGSLQDGVNTWTGAGGSSTTPMMLGEWNMDDSGFGGNYNFNNDSYQCTYPGACFAANTILGGLNGAQFFQYGSIWEAYQDTDYGIVGAQDNGGGLNISPNGYVLSKGSNVGYGTRCAWTQVISGPALTGFAVQKGPGPNNFCVILINPNSSSASGTVALSSWPVNSTGTATVNLYTVGQNNTTGTLNSSIAVTGGTTATITIPAGCVSFLYF